MPDDAEQTTSQSDDMDKRILSKGLGLGGARVSTVVLGVILSVMLGLAAVSTSQTPAVGQGIRIAANLSHRVETRGRVLHTTTDVRRYEVPIVTYWTLENTQECISPPRQLLQRQVENGDQWAPVFGGDGFHGYLRDSVVTGKTYRYRLRVECDTAGRGPPLTGSIYDTRFEIRAYQEDAPSTILAQIAYRGQWEASSAANPSGGSTLVAKQVGANATITYEGIAAAWVSTWDDEASVKARVACDRMLCATVSTSRPPGRDPLFDNLRVVWSGKWDTNNTSNFSHRVQVIADHPSDVDVDMFLTIHKSYGPPDPPF